MTEHRGATAGTAPATRSTRGQFVLAVVVCTAGAALALWAASKGWAETVTRQPGPMSDVHRSTTGADFAPVVSPLALIGLAGAGALVATRRLGRRVVGVLLVLVGAGVAGDAGYGLSDASGAAGYTGPGWPVAAILGGLLVAATGTFALRRGHAWPTMGSRYERTGRPAPVDATDDPAKVWDALDAGDDPTRR